MASTRLLPPAQAGYGPEAMRSSPDADPPRIFLDARHREHSVCWLLHMHPVTATTLVSLRWFARKRKARKCLHKLLAGGLILLVGTIRRGRGRPEHVYCRWRPDPAHLLQEVQLTEVFLRLDAGEIRRGPLVSDPAVSADAELRIDGRLFYLELDRGADEAVPPSERLPAYDECPHTSLWVCLTHDRMEELRRRARRLRSTALFTTVAEALASPHAEIWRDHAGGVVALPREGTNSRG